MRQHALLFLALLVALLPLVVVAQTGPAETRFRALLDDDWKFWMAQYPETATALGYPGQDARWTDYSAAAIASRASYLRETVARLEAVDRDALPAAEQLNYDLYRDMIVTAVEGLAFGNDAMPLRGVVVRNLRMPMNQMDGVQQDVARVFALMPAAAVHDYENLIARLEKVPALVDQTIVLMRDGLAQGMTPPQVTFRDVPRQVEAQIVANPLESPLLEAFTKWPSSVPEVDRTRLTRAAVAAYTEAVRPAFTRLHQFLVDTYLPACRSSVGVDALPRGAELYAYNVRWHTTTAKTPKEIHEIGLAEVKRIRGEMDRIMTKVGFKGRFADFKTFLRTDPRFYYTDADSLVSGYRDVAKRADPELAHLFGTLPRTPYGVRRVPDASAPSQTTAYYEPGALAAGRPGNMFANTYMLDARPKWEMEALTLHEAVPGHHLQIALAQELVGLPEFRKNTSYTAYVEGWGLYAESLGEEMGFYKDPYSKFGQLTYEMWRAVRLVVDTGLHSMGWTRQQAIDFFADNAAKTLQDITVEVDRYIVWPGQAVGYKIGQLRIRELRADAERRLGPKFDVRAFHDVVLGQGAVPLDVLGRMVAEWISKRGAGPAGKGE
jgi:uncharacterized protein (DUF885 family)